MRKTTAAMCRGNCSHHIRSMEDLESEKWTFMILKGKVILKLGLYGSLNKVYGHDMVLIELK